MSPSAVTVGATAFHDATVAGLPVKKPQNKSAAKVTKEQDMVLKTFRLLIADLCQQFGGGHPGYV
jgi:dihydroxyacetone synthase